MMAHLERLLTGLVVLGMTTIVVVIVGLCLFLTQLLWGWPITLMGSVLWILAMGYLLGLITEEGK